MEGVPKVRTPLENLISIKRFCCDFTDFKTNNSLFGILWLCQHKTLRECLLYFMQMSCAI